MESDFSGTMCRKVILPSPNCFCTFAKYQLGTLEWVLHLFQDKTCSLYFIRTGLGCRYPKWARCSSVPSHSAPRLTAAQQKQQRQTLLEAATDGFQQWLHPPSRLSWQPSTSCMSTGLICEANKPSLTCAEIFIPLLISSTPCFVFFFLLFFPSSFLLEVAQRSRKYLSCCYTVHVFNLTRKLVQLHGTFI